MSKSYSDTLLEADIQRTQLQERLKEASYDKESNKFRSFCKVGTGFTDENLRLI